jgi:hypothetical protein
VVQVQGVEQGEVHGDEGGQMMMIKAPTWKRRKRKIKTYGDQGKGINRILFCQKDTIKDVIGFRIDCRTMKRGYHGQNSYQVPLGEFILAYALGPSVLILTLENMLKMLLTHMQIC